MTSSGGVAPAGSNAGAHVRARAARVRRPAAWRTRALFVLAALCLCAAVQDARAQGQGDDEPSIAIRPFGDASQPKTGDAAGVPAAQAGGAPGTSREPAAIDAVGADPIALAIDAAAGKLYWAEYRTGRIRRAGLDGNAPETIVEGLDGPVAIALGGDGFLYWVTDANFPRRLQRVALDGGQIETLALGEELNRPGTVTVDAGARRLYWAEAVSGRIRRCDFDGSSIENLHDERMLASFGIALHLPSKHAYWSDLTHARIQRMPLDGGDVGDIRTEADGLDFPAGLAIDASASEIYWADRNSGTIRRAPLAGGAAREILGPAHGLVEPHAIALHVPVATGTIGASPGTVFWTDLATDEIMRAELDGSGAKVVARLPAGFERAVVARLPERTAASGSSSAAVCRDRLTAEGARLARATYKAVATCLDKMSFVKAVKWRAVEPSLAAGTCARSLAALGDGAKPGSAEAAFASALAAPCDPSAASFPPGALTAMEIDATGFVCDESKVKDGAAAGWISCAADRYASLAFDALAARYVRAGEWLEEARPFVRKHTGAKGKEGAKVPSAALAALDAAAAEIEKRTAATAAHAPGFPATGLRTTYAAERDDGIAGPVAVPDDGALGAGAPLRFRDNGDGTVTDLNTELVWEKKCDGCGGLHDSLFGYRWSGDGGQETVWDWLAQINAEGGAGFAGHSDWRIANVKELVSIADYERFNPSTTAAFDGALCGLGCSDLKNAECSCTAQGPYWSSTTFSDFPAHAYVVTFNLGLVGDDVKTTRHFVRAVRGPVR